MTGPALTRYNAWRLFASGPGLRVFSPRSEVTPGGQPGIAIYLENEGQLEHAQQMTGHEPPQTTKLYDRTKDKTTLSEVERFRL